MWFTNGVLATSTSRESDCFIDLEEFQITDVYNTLMTTENKFG